MRRGERTAYYMRIRLNNDTNFCDFDASRNPRGTRNRCNPQAANFYPLRGGRRIMSMLRLYLVTRLFCIFFVFVCSAHIRCYSDHVFVSAFMTSTPLAINKKYGEYAMRSIIKVNASKEINSKSTTSGKNSKQRNHRSRKNFKFSPQLAQAKAINKEVINSSSAQDVLELFIAKGGAKEIAGGGVFNSVNYSTLMHRMARFASAPYVNSHHRNSQYKHQRGNGKSMSGQKMSNLPVDARRKLILSDPRFAILIASLSEAMINKDDETLVFSNRELANLGWAIAKLKVSPPSSIYPMTRCLGHKKHSVNETQRSIKYTSKEEFENDILLMATSVRAQVLEVAKRRSTVQDPNRRAKIPSTWIPTLSQLSAKLLDIIAIQVLDMVENFNSQELANLLYAFANAGRGDEYLFNSLAVQLISSMKHQAANKQMYQKNPKPQEFSNSVWAFASAGLRGSGQIELLKYIADTFDGDNGRFVRQFKAQELSNTAWGIATIISKRGYVSDQRINEDFKLEDESSLRILRWVGESLEERIEEFKPQEISNSIWAFATVGFGAAKTISQVNTNSENISLPSNREAEDRDLLERVVSMVTNNASTRLHMFRPQELNNLAWGLCKLGHYNGSLRALFKGIGQQILKRHRQFAPQDIGTTLWSFATVEYFDKEVYRAAASRLTLRDCRSFKPQELSNTVWALATSGAFPEYENAFDTTLVPSSKRTTLSEMIDDPITECFAAATTELIRRPRDFKEQEIKDILWSLSKAGIRHPTVFKKVAEHLVGSDDDISKGLHSRGLNGFSPQGVGNLAWSFAKQAQLADAVSGSVIQTSGRLAIYETSCLDIGETLINRLFRKIAERGIDPELGLSRYKPQDISNTCWAFATLGLTHKTFFGAVSDTVKERLSFFDPLSPNKDSANSSLIRFKAQEIANLVWSFATLNYRAEGMMDLFAPFMIHMCSHEGGCYDIHSISKYIKRQEAGNIAWSCAVLEQYPPELMPMLYTALFGSENDNPDLLKEAYNDDGLQRQAIMTMFYVQMTMDIEAPQLKLHLPRNFPNDWSETLNNNQRTSTSPSFEDARDTSSMLTLTTSRLQQDVSRAFSRVGFEHTIEHVIRTDEIEVNCVHDMSSFSSEKTEFLSIDIANIKDKIGVEVDGPGHFVNILDGNSDDDGRADLSSVPAMSNRDGAVIKKVGGIGWKFNSESLRQFNGPTALKHRLLSHLGWYIIHLPFWEWRDLDGDAEKEDVYCNGLIEEITG